MRELEIALERIFGITRLVSHSVLSTINHMIRILKDEEYGIKPIGSFREIEKIAHLSSFVMLRQALPCRRMKEKKSIIMLLEHVLWVMYRRWCLGRIVRRGLRAVLMRLDFQSRCFLGMPTDKR